MVVVDYTARSGVICKNEFFIKHRYVYLDDMLIYVLFVLEWIDERIECKCARFK
jgi:hypothetical protein